MFFGPVQAVKPKPFSDPSVLVEKANFYKDGIRIFNPDWTSCPIWRSMWTPISKDNGYP